MEVINKRVQLTHTKPTESNHGYHSELKVITTEGTKFLGDVYNDDLTHLESFLNAFDAIPDMIHVIEKWNETQDVIINKVGFNEYSVLWSEFHSLMKAVSDKLEL